jgi:hypothetical protein
MCPLKGRHFLRFPTSAYILLLEAFSLTFDAVDAPNWTSPTLTFGPCVPISTYLRTAHMLMSRRRARTDFTLTFPYFLLIRADFHLLPDGAHPPSPSTRARTDFTLTFPYLSPSRREFCLLSDGADRTLRSASTSAPIPRLLSLTFRPSAPILLTFCPCTRCPVGLGNFLALSHRTDSGLLSTYFHVDSFLNSAAAHAWTRTAPTLCAPILLTFRADFTYFRTVRADSVLTLGRHAFAPFRAVFTLTFSYFPLSRSDFCLLSDGAHPPCPSAPIPRLPLLTFRSHAPIFTYFPAHAHGLGISLPPALQGRSFSRFHSGEFLQVPRPRRRFLIDSLLTLHRNLLTSGPCQRRFSLMPGRRGTPQTSKEGHFSVTAHGRPH